jgi:hypothetical protein
VRRTCGSSELGGAEKTATVDEFAKVFWKVFLFEEATAELTEGTILDLANSFPSDAELVTDLLKSSFLRIAQAKAEVKNFNLTGGKNLEGAGDRLTEIDPLVLFGGIDGNGIRKEIAEGTVFSF